MTRRNWTAATALTAALAGLALLGTFRAGAYPDEQQDNTKREIKKTTTKVENPQNTQEEAAFPRRAEEQALRKAVEDYCASFNKGDLDAVASSWTHDAEYVNEDGKSFRGRDAIRRLMKKAMEDHKGSKQSIKIRSIRFVKPDVAVEEGTVFMTAPEGNIEPGRYSAIWVKQQGKWRINSVHDLPAPAQDEGPAAFNKLKPLAWMVGEWQDKSGKGDVRLSCRWAPKQTFLLLDFTIKRSEGAQLAATERIGWDPHAETLLSWLFDSSGGFGEGDWSRQGNTWRIDSESVLADGRVLTATHAWKYVDDDTIEWSSTNRQADEAPLPDLNVTFVRLTKER
jgi:uncharacterized protein (TIGR02246 family)